MSDERKIWVHRFFLSSSSLPLNIYTQSNIYLYIPFFFALVLSYIICWFTHWIVSFFYRLHIYIGNGIKKVFYISLIPKKLWLLLIRLVIRMTTSTTRRTRTEYQGEEKKRKEHTMTHRELWRKVIYQKHKKTLKKIHFYDRFNYTRTMNRAIERSSSSIFTIEIIEKI